MAWTDYLDDVGGGALGGAATGATIGSVVPVIGTGIGAGAGALIGGLTGYVSEHERQSQQASANNLISSYLNGGVNRYLSPQVMAQAQNWALQGGGGFGGDPRMKALARQWATGGGGIDFNTQLAHQFLRGGVDPATMSMLNRTVGRQFDNIRNQQGAAAARSGLARSSIGQRLMADAYDSERNALADAVVRSSLARQQLGLGMLSQADASRLARQNLGANEFARQQNFDVIGRNLDLNYRRMGIGALSDAEARAMARQQFGLNARLGVLGQEQARQDATWQGIAELGGGLYSEHMEGKRRAADLEAFKKHSQEMRGLLKQITPARTGFPSYHPTAAQIQRPSLTHAKAKNIAGGGGLKSPFLTGTPSGLQNTVLGRKSILQRRQGAGGVRSNPLSSR